jgi:hypothetical protein
MPTASDDSAAMALGRQSYDYQLSTQTMGDMAIYGEWIVDPDGNDPKS